MSKTATIKIPENAIQWSGEVLTNMSPKRQKFHDQLFPDLPEGEYHIKAIGFAIPISDEEA